MRDSGSTTEDVQDFEQVVHAQRQGGRLEQQQQERGDNPYRPESIHDRLDRRVNQVGDRRHQQEGKQLGGQDAPPG